MIYTMGSGRVGPALLTEAARWLQSVGTLDKATQEQVNAFFSMCMWSELAAMAQKGLMVEDDPATFNAQLKSCFDSGTAHFFERPLNVQMTSVYQPTMAGHAFGLVNAAHWADYFDSASVCSMVWAVLYNVLNTQERQAEAPTSTAAIFAYILSAWGWEARATFDVSKSNSALSATLAAIEKDPRLACADSGGNQPR